MRNPQGPLPRCATRAWAVPLMRLMFNQMNGRGSQAPRKGGNRKSVTGIVQQSPAANSSLARGTTKSARHRRAASRKELDPSRGTVVLLCSRTMIQCLQGVLDLVQMHRLIAHLIRAWLLTEEGYTHTQLGALEELNHLL